MDVRKEERTASFKGGTCPAKLTMPVDGGKADLALVRVGAFLFAPLVAPRERGGAPGARGGVEHLTGATVAQRRPSTRSLAISRLSGACQRM